MEGLMPKIQLFLKRNGSTILTVVGAAGVIATAVAAAKASPKALKLIEKAEEEKGEKLSKGEQVRIAGPAFIPTAAMGAATIGCVFGANVLNKHQQAALVSLYSMADASYKTYKNKVKTMLGEDVDRQIIHAIAEDKLKESDITPTDDGKIVFMEFNSLMPFESTMEAVKKAEDDLNELIRVRGYASLADYHELLGIDSIKEDNEIGWFTSLLKLNDVDRVEFTYDLSKSVTVGGKDYCLICSSIEPTSDFLYM